MKRLDESLRKKYIHYLEDHVSKKRLKHSLGVAETAVQLAQKYGADPLRAEAAGLLHDCSKGLSPADMTVLDAVVNLADYIEPTRSYPDVDEIRRLAQGSLFDTLCEALGRTMILTIRQGSVLHPDTLVTWNALILRSKAEKGEEK